MGRFREAAVVLEEGLKIDPFSAALKCHLDAATRGNLADLLAGCKQLFVFVTVLIERSSTAALSVSARHIFTAGIYCLVWKIRALTDLPEIPVLGVNP